MANNVQVLLQTNVEALGKGGEVVKVRAGFARNYLLPRGLAVPATAGNLARVEEFKRLSAQKAQQELDAAKELGQKITATKVKITRAGGDEGKMYGSVTTKDIEEAFAAAGVQIDRKRLQLSEPIKTFGSVQVPLRLHADLTVNLDVEVAKR